MSNYLDTLKNFCLRRRLRPSPLTGDAGGDAGDSYVFFEVVVVDVH